MTMAQVPLSGRPRFGEVRRFSQTHTDVVVLNPGSVISEPMLWTHAAQCTTSKGLFCWTTPSVECSFRYFILNLAFVSPTRFIFPHPDQGHLSACVKTSPFPRILALTHPSSFWAPCCPSLSILNPSILNFGVPHPQSALLTHSCKAMS